MYLTYQLVLQVYENIFHISGDETKTSANGAVYKPTSKILQKNEEEKSKDEGKSFPLATGGISSRPLVRTVFILSCNM